MPLIVRSTFFTKCALAGSLRLRDPASTQTTVDNDSVDVVRGVWKLSPYDSDSDSSDAANSGTTVNAFKLVTKTRMPPFQSNSAY